MITLMNVEDGRVMHLDRDVQALLRIKRMGRRLRAWAEAVEGVEGDFVWVLVRLSYRPGCGWRPGHIRDFMLSVRRVCDPVAYAWVAELTRAGVVHYHVILVMPRGEWLPKPDDAGLWPWGSTRVEVARRRVAYLVSYARKLEQKGLGGVAFPKGIRVFSVWVKRGLLDDGGVFKLRLSVLPWWLGEIASNLGSIPSRREGGGWEFGDWAGGVVYSPWELVKG